MSDNHWNCCVAGCLSNHRHEKNDPSLHYFRIPKRHRSAYQVFCKTDDVNWDRARICSKHWSKPSLRRGKRGFDVLPDIRVPGAPRAPKSQRSLSSPYDRAATRNKGNKDVDRVTKKLSAAEEECRQKAEIIEALKKKVADLETRDATNTEKMSSMAASQIETMNQLTDQLQEARNRAQESETKLKVLKTSRNITCFTHMDDNQVSYFTGFNKETFNTLMDLFLPYLHLMQYDGCKHSFNSQRKLSKEVELFATLLMLRHGLDAGIVAWFVGVTANTINRMFEAWITFGSAIFSKLNLDHPKSLIKDKIPKSFAENGYSHTVLVLDATEFKLTNCSDLQLNCVFFSDYKNTHTAKGLIGITPHGSLCHIPDLYPGSVSDNDITVITDALRNVQQDDCILVDKGFGIAEQAAEKGAVVNRPPMASEVQFTSGEVEANFKIAHLRIHVERWIGKLRHFSILNKVWHTSRLDLLNETVKFCAHLLNIMTVVGPKE